MPFPASVRRPLCACMIQCNLCHWITDPAGVSLAGHTKQWRCCHCRGLAQGVTLLVGLHTYDCNLAMLLKRTCRAVLP